MRIYTALLKANAEPVLIREGFSWATFILGPLWLALHRAWVAAAFSLAVYGLIAALAPQPAGGILLFALALILGWSGHDLQRRALESRGYLLVHVIAASNMDAGLDRLLTYRPDLAIRFRPDLA